MIIIDKFSSKINILVYMIHLYRFSVIVITILIALSLVWFGLRNYGLSRDASNFQTPLIESLTTSERPHSWTKLSQLQEAPYSYASILFSNNQWNYIEPTGEKKNLGDLLKTRPNSYFLFFVDLEETQELAKLKELIDSGEFWKRIIFTSSKDGVVTEMRKLSPQWSFANGEIFLTRFLSLATIGLEPLLEIPGDSLFIRPAMLKHPQVKNLIFQAKKHKKYILVGPVARPLEDIDADGWLIEQEKTTE